MSQEVVLFSGGMDSYVAAFMYPNATLVHVDFREQYEDKQLAAIKRIAPRHVEMLTGLDLSQFLGEDGVYLPNRNMLLATLGAMYGDTIILGAIAGDVYPDHGTVFGDLLSATLSHINGAEYKVLFPFSHLTKYDLVSEYIALGGDPLDLKHTLSCYHPTETACMKCRSCLRKLVAMGLHGFRLDEVKEYAPRISDLIRENKWSSDPADIAQTTRLLNMMRK